MISLSWSSSLCILNYLREISKLLCSRNSLEVETMEISNVNVSELSGECISLLQNMDIPELKGLSLRSIPVSGAFCRLPARVVAGYTLGVSAFVEEGYVDIRVYPVDYPEYPSLEMLLRYIERDDTRPVSFPDFSVDSGEAGMLWLHTDNGFVESDYTEDGRVDRPESEGVSSRVLEVMSWVEGVREDIFELYILKNPRLEVAYFLQETSGEFSVLLC